VGLAVETPDFSVVFNVGPTLDKIGIQVIPVGPSSTTTTTSAATADEDEDQLEFTVERRVMIEDGANISRVAGSFPDLRVRLDAEIFNFTYEENPESTKSTYTVCSLVRDNVDPSSVSIVAPAGSFAGSFAANAKDGELAQEAEAVFGEAQPLRADRPGPLAATLALSSGLGGTQTLVIARDVFSVLLPAEAWQQVEAETAAPQCTTKHCDRGDRSCLLTI